MFGRCHRDTNRGYANCEDFRHVFEENLRQIYLLAFLILADRSAAEECLLLVAKAGIPANRIFKSWLLHWMKRQIVKAALTTCRAGFKESVLGSSKQTISGKSAELSAVLSLKALDRHVFVMTVLEGYSIRECALELDLHMQQISEVRQRSLVNLALLDQVTCRDAPVPECLYKSDRLSQSNS